MTDYTALANAIKTTLEADSWVGDAANIVTLETFERDFSLQGLGEDQFFKEAELPAVNIVPNRGKEQDLETVGEILESIQCELIAESFDPDPLTAAQEHDAMIKNLERVLAAQNTSLNDLGIDALVKEISTETGDFKKGKNYFYQSRISFTAILTQAY